MFPMVIQQTLYWGVVKQIETLKKYFGFVDDPDYPEGLKPSAIELSNLIINIEKSLNYLEDHCQISIKSLRNNFNGIKKTSPGRLIPLVLT